MIIAVLTFIFSAIAVLFIIWLGLNIIGYALTAVITVITAPFTIYEALSTYVRTGVYKEPSETSLRIVACVCVIAIPGIVSYFNGML